MSSYLYDEMSVCLNTIIFGQRGRKCPNLYKLYLNLNLNLNLLTTTHHNNDSTYEQSYNAKTNNTDTCIRNIRVMSIEQ